MKSLSRSSVMSLVCGWSVFVGFLADVEQVSNAGRARADDPVLVIKAGKLYPVSGPMIEHAAIVCAGGKIVALGEAARIQIPDDARVMEAAVVTPGLIDVRTSVGLSGVLNTPQDSDQLESSSPVQPELRAIDAYNPREELVDYIRGYGVTTIHTGHAPGELISGQTIITKTVGRTVEESLLVEGRAVVATLAESSLKSSGKQSPGTRGKQMAMLRSLLIEAQEYRRKLDAQLSPDTAQAATPPDASASDTAADKPAEGKAVAGDSAVPRNLKLEAMVDVLRGRKALVLTADRAQDIASALRLGEEFGIAIWLDSAAEAYQLLPQLQAAKVQVLLHPTMARSTGERENLKFTTARELHEAGIPFAIQGGFEAYVPKARVVLFEAAVAAGHGLPYAAALESITLAPARMLGIHDRVGSLEIGKDADLALFDGDPFEYTSHCTAVVIDGRVVSEQAN
jgi:imidazolonepropionase-like amidohydrolase